MGKTREKDIDQDYTVCREYQEHALVDRPESI
jgi:hypothetical protein